MVLVAYLASLALAESAVSLVLPEPAVFPALLAAQQHG
jgi:hypothetical protein